MKFLTPLFILLVGLSSMAEYGHRNNPYEPGRPGGRPGYPNPSRPGRPNYPPPQYGGVYGPGYTYRFQDYGQFQLNKGIEQNLTIDVRGLYVNEISIRALKNHVGISSVLAYLVDGQIIDLRQVTGQIRTNTEFRSTLDYRSSLRVDRIVIQATSPNLIGSRALVQVVLGLAQ